MSEPVAVSSADWAADLGVLVVVSAALTTDSAGGLTVESPAESATVVEFASVAAFPAQNQVSLLAQRVAFLVGTLAVVLVGTTSAVLVESTAIVWRTTAFGAAAWASASAVAASGGTQDDTSGCVVMAASSDRASGRPASAAFLTDASCAVLWLLPHSARFREVVSRVLDRAVSFRPIFAAAVLAGLSCLAENCELPVDHRGILPLVGLGNVDPRRVVFCLAAVDG